MFQMELAAATRRLCFRGFTRWVLPKAGWARLKMPLSLLGGGMFKKLWRVGVLGLLSGALGCSSPNPNVRVHRLAEGRLEVEGPLAGPFQTIEELATSACELMTSQPGASNGRYGFEYCGLYYYSTVEQAFFLSYLSDISRQLPDGTVTCDVPRALNDPRHPDALILGYDHNHPGSRNFSPRDLSERSLWKPTRFAEKGSQRIWDRKTMVFHREKSGSCSAFLYNNTTRIVSALREGKWIDIGLVYNEKGDIQMFEGMDWLP
jgi:hypothetical protein